MSDRADVLSGMQRGLEARRPTSGPPSDSLPSILATMPPDQLLAALFGGGRGIVRPMSPGLGSGAPMPVRYEDASYGAGTDPVQRLIADWMNRRFPNGQ